MTNKLKKLRVVLIILFSVITILFIIENFLVIKNGQGFVFSSRAAKPIDYNEDMTRANFSGLYVNTFFPRKKKIESPQFKLISKKKIGEREIYIYSNEKIKNLYVICSFFDNDVSPDVITSVVIDNSLDVKNIKNHKWHITDKYGGYVACPRSDIIQMPGTLLTGGKLVNTWRKKDINTVLRLLPPKEN